jgi:hypothetical protein
LLVPWTNSSAISRASANLCRPDAAESRTTEGRKPVNTACPGNLYLAARDQIIEATTAVGGEAAIAKLYSMPGDKSANAPDRDPVQMNRIVV